MLRVPAVGRALSSTSLLAPAIRRSSPKALHIRSLTTAQEQVRGQSSHAVSNPTLANIEKRWEAMPPQEQAELWMALRDRMTVDWNQLTLQEKKASYYIAFGPHGPRAVPDPREKWQVLKLFVYAMVASAGIFALIRMGARPPPSTMNQEWQEATNEYLRSQNAEPITGISSEGYVGKGQVQSPPRGASPKGDDE